MFAIYLSSEQETRVYNNAYGYYSGKCYTRDQEYFPVTQRQVTEETKRYTSKAKAIKGAEAVFNKCGYVLSFEIEEISS